MSGSEIIAKIKQKQIADLISQGMRADGRKLTDYRKIAIQLEPIEKAEGSALVSLGNTKVMTGVKIEVGDPFPDTPNEGVLTVNAELLPLASPTFEPGPPDERSVELARVVDRGIRESKAIDVGKLCLIPGKKVFVIFADVYILDYDGNLFDASSIATLSALLKTRIPEYEVRDGEVYLRETKAPLPMRSRPVSVTMAKIGGKLVVDPSLDEEQVMDARVTMAIDENGNLCAIQKGGTGTFTRADVVSAMKIAVAKSEEIRKKIVEAVELGQS
jgi:exosome complex component RRP42